MKGNNKQLLIRAIFVFSLLMIMAASLVDAGERSAQSMHKAKSNLGKRSTKACQPGSCNGPVVVHFEYQNCTGEKVYSELLLNTSIVDGNCVQDGDDPEFYYKMTIRSDSIEEVYYNGPTEETCQDGPGMYTETYGAYFGVCFVEDNQSPAPGGTMFLPSADATFQAPQQHVQGSARSYPEIKWQSCPSPGNCTDDDGTLTWMKDWYTLNEANQCNASTIFSTYSYSGFTPNVCYNGQANWGYTMYVCSTPTSFTQLYFGGNGCEKLAWSYTEKSECMWDDREGVSLRCITPLPLPVPPVSSASQVMMMSVGFVVAIALAILL